MLKVVTLTMLIENLRKIIHLSKLEVFMQTEIGAFSEALIIFANVIIAFFIFGFSFFTCFKIIEKIKKI